MKLDAKTTERFISKIEKTDDCWKWLGATKNGGYGTFYYKGKSEQAHRFSYEYFTDKKIRFGLEIDHLCRNPNCVNPKHLEPVTHRENMMRSSAPCALAAKQTHCIHGHPFTGTNNKIRIRKGRAWRVCRTCRNLVQMRHMEKKHGRPIGKTRVHHV